MTTAVLACLAALCLFAVLTIGRTAAADAPIVRVVAPGGPVAGRARDGLAVFKGIPYAKPPVGDLRFAPTETIEPWTETRDCGEYGAKAVQATVNGIGAVKSGVAESEDCLFLNVWTPEDFATGGRRPVFVFIHGGGYAVGSASDPLYDPSWFAKQGIVAVTVNYRLNALGFMATRETYNRYGTTGNWGHLDQIKALEWIRDNIAAFGGDPGNVTVGGESSGSYSASALILSPLAAGLFHGAILESGSILSVPVNNYYAQGDLDRSIEVCAMMARLFGAGDDAAGLARLRRADAKTLAELSPLNPGFITTTAFFTVPVFDGAVLPRNPAKAIADRRFNRVRLLFGFNTDEGSMFIPARTNAAQYRMIATRMFGEDKANKVLERFPVDAGRTAMRQARLVLKCAMFTSGMKALADALAAESQTVYGYHFAYVSPDMARLGMGAAHGQELAYLFGTFPQWGIANPTEDQKKVSAEMRIRWANFILNGDPNRGFPAPSGTVWPRYEGDAPKVLRFDATVGVEPLPDGEEMDFVWDMMK